MSETNEGIFSCKGICWIIGALLGIAAYLILRGRMEMSFILALIIALVILVGAALLLRAIFCGEVEASDGGAAGIAAAGTGVAASAAAAGSTSAAALDSGASVTSKTPDAGAVAGEVAKADAAGKDGGSKAADAGKSSTSKTTTAKASPAKKPAAKKAPAKKPAAKASKPAAKASKPAAKAAKPVAKKPAAKKPAAKKPAAKKSGATTSSTKTTTAAKKPAMRPVAKDGKPRTMKAARKGGADDLKLLKGVGPKLEQTLNDMGFYHFDQVAGWRKAEVEWVDSRLKFKGRIERDGWIKQAKVLARGGETEFSKKASKAK